MYQFLRIIKHLFITLTLTITTQIGGVAYLISLMISKYWKLEFRLKKTIIFLGLYLGITFGVVPFVAPFFGREKIENSTLIKPVNYGTILLNRNYVRPKLNNLIQQTAKTLATKHPNIQLQYLDANFPFFDKFPLLPHLSHNDGKKLDLSLIYQNDKGEVTNQKKSVSGYGAFEKPTIKEFDQIDFCESKGYFQYSYPQYLTFGSINSELTLSDKATKDLINILLSSPSLGKIFIEPHLKQRLNLNRNRIRYHGCKAVRHDDHIHIQLK